jgi:hypothetical protein
VLDIGIGHRAQGTGLRAQGIEKQRLRQKTKVEAKRRPRTKRRV